MSLYFSPIEVRKWTHKYTRYMKIMLFFKFWIAMLVEECCKFNNKAQLLSQYNDFSVLHIYKNLQTVYQNKSKHTS